MSRYIDAEKIEFHATPVQWKFREYIAIQSEVDAIPKADVEQVRHGHWIPHEFFVRSPFATNYDCSECGRENFDYPSCPYCRALMDGKENEE